MVYPTDSPREAVVERGDSLTASERPLKAELNVTDKGQVLGEKILLLLHDPFYRRLFITLPGHVQFAELQIQLVVFDSINGWDLKSSGELGAFVLRFGFQVVRKNLPGGPMFLVGTVTDKKLPAPDS